MTPSQAAEGVSDADLAERIAEVERRIELTIESFGSAPEALREKLSILTELQHLRRLSTQNTEGWVSVSERLPPECTKVLAVFDDSYGGFSLIATREGDKWYDETICNGLREISDVVLWRPIPDWTLPAPPTLASRDVT